MDYDSHQEKIHASLDKKRVKLEGKIVEKEDGYFAVIDGVVKSGWFSTVEKSNEKHGPFSTYPAAKEALSNAMKVHAKQWKGGSYFAHDVLTNTYRGSAR